MGISALEEYKFLAKKLRVYLLLRNTKQFTPHCHPSAPTPPKAIPDSGIDATVHSIRIHVMRIHTVITGKGSIQPPLPAIGQHKRFCCLWGERILMVSTCCSNSPFFS